MSDTYSRPRIGFVVSAIAFVLLATLIVVGVVVKRTSSEQSKAGSGISTSTPGSTPTNTPIPSEAPASLALMDDVDEEDLLPEVLEPTVSDEPQPSTSQIWAYEQAYFTPDPVQREQLMKSLATEQYLAEDLSHEPAKFDGVEVRVVQAESEIVSVTVGANRFTAFVITRVFLETIRSGQVVNRFLAPQHSSAWVNTDAGWRVIKNVGED